MKASSESGVGPTTFDFLSEDVKVGGKRATVHDSSKDSFIHDADTNDYVAMDKFRTIINCDNDIDNNFVSMDIGKLYEYDRNYVPDVDEDSNAAPSVTSSVVTREGIQDIHGFVCICLVILVGDMSRGVMFPSMWPLVKSLGGSPVLLGYSVAAFSFGRTIVNPLFGYWSDRQGYRIALFSACTVLLLGTFIYAQIQNIGRVSFLIFAQMVLGVGSGTLGVTRAFVADVTDRRNRTKYMAYITAVQYGGFTMTPAIGALFFKLFDENDYAFVGGFIRLNKYTAPAYFLGACVTITIGIMSLYLNDRVHVSVPTKKSQKQLDVEDFANSTTPCFNLTIYDCCIIGCMLLNVATKGSIACFETLGIAIAQEYFEMQPSRAGMIIAICGTLGVISLLNMGQLENRFSDVQIISTGIITMILGVTMLFGVDEQIPNPTWQYIVSICFIYSIGYPIGHTAVIGLFSKIIGRRPQGTLLGWFASAGSLARVLFPIMSGYIAHYSTIESLFVVLVGVLLASTVYVLVSRKTLNLLSK